ncbi:MAG: DUF2851 family protein [Bacteroidota bacterium]
MINFKQAPSIRYCIRERKPAVPEDDVVRMWLQRAQPDVEFETQCLRRVRVIDPGTRNRHDGPDFLRCVITVDGVLRRGDIEVHTHPEDWRRHGHDCDARYGGVVLHVCLYDGEVNVPFPTIVLAGQLGQPFRDSWCMARDHRHALPCMRSGNQQNKIHNGIAAVQSQHSLDPQSVMQSMTVLASARRFDRKLQRMSLRHEMLRRENDDAYAFRQLVYEHFARASGYGGNERQFEALSRAVPLSELSALTAAGRASRLAAAAGLNRTAIPLESGSEAPSQASWNSAAVMPHNRIGRRLQWFASWAPVLENPAWWRKLFSLLREGAAAAEAFAPLFQVELQRENPGPERIAEFMINVIAPALRLYGLQRGDAQLARAALKLYVASTPAPQNRHTRILTTAFELACDSGEDQQGMIELSTEFCEKERCGQCLFSHI